MQLNGGNSFYFSVMNTMSNNIDMVMIFIGKSKSTKLIHMTVTTQKIYINEINNKYIYPGITIILFISKT